MDVQPIGTFHCDARYPYDAARQPGHAHASTGWVALAPQQGFEQALLDLAGFSHIWLVYQFHHNEHWKPMVTPPRADRKVGVFATRAPYRPNPIGLSCVELRSVSGLRVEVGKHDLLDGTPILDIKPYVPYADSFPNARCGWLEEVDVAVWTLSFSQESELQLSWLEQHSELRLRAFLTQQLAEQPFETRRKRIRAMGDDTWEIAYRTWRARYTADATAQLLHVLSVSSGYTDADLTNVEDHYHDKDLHRRFIGIFPGSR